MKKQSEKLSEFYKHIFEWLETGSENNPFCKDVGLCVNLAIWLHDQEASLKAIQAYTKELKLQFKDAELDTRYPFGGEGCYAYEEEMGTLYKNSERLSWVVSHVEVI